MCGLVFRALAQAPANGATYADVVNKMLALVGTDRKPAAVQDVHHEPLLVPPGDRAARRGAGGARGRRGRARVHRRAGRDPEPGRLLRDDAAGGVHRRERDVRRRGGAAPGGVRARSSTSRRRRRRSASGGRRAERRRRRARATTRPGPALAEEGRMQISVRRSGGFAGIEEERSVDTARARRRRARAARAARAGARTSSRSRRRSRARSGPTSSATTSRSQDGGRSHTVAFAGEGGPGVEALPPQLAEAVLAS